MRKNKSLDTTTFNMTKRATKGHTRVKFNPLEITNYLSIPGNVTYILIVLPIYST